VLPSFFDAASCETSQNPDLIEHIKRVENDL
jgi:hypothetical protein